MLLQFSVKNIASFKSETTFDMTATSIQDHKYCLIDAGGINVLPVATIYGPNAAGKTNLLKSLVNNVYLICNSVTISDLTPFVLPYLFDNKTENADSCFEIIIVCDVNDAKYEFCYGYSLNTNRICAEYLYFKIPTNNAYITIYEIDSEGNIEIGKSKKIISDKERKNIKFCNSIKKDNELLLTLLGLRDENSNENTCFRSIMKELKKYLPFPKQGAMDNMSIIFSESEDEISKVYNKEYIEGEAIDFIRKADPSIKSLMIVNNNGDKTKKRIATIHDTTSNKDSAYDVSLESSGTINMILAYPRIKRVLDDGGVLIADEIDAQLHPMMLQYIIGLFMNPKTNPNHAQLISTLHNVIIMDRRNLRRDSIYFVEKDKENKSRLYSLSDIEINNKKVRNDADYCKQYILGMYGAIPSFEKDVMSDE